MLAKAAMAALAFTIGMTLAGGIATAAGGEPKGVKACVSKADALTLRVKGRCPTGSRHLTLDVPGRAGPRGPKGSPGKNGEPAPAVLASGKTEQGLFDNNADATADDDGVGTAITFPIPLATGIAAANIVEVQPGESSPDPTHCAGTVNAPTAAPGFLCLYEYARVDVLVTKVQEADTATFGTSPDGFIYTSNADGVGNVIDEGSWAVTAP